MRERILSIQALRFVAAAMVVYDHSSMLAVGVAGRYGALSSKHLELLGAGGVDIFFIISGLVIALTGPVAQPRPTAAQFFWRRWSRVAPLFWLMTIPALMTYSITGPVSAIGSGGAMNADQNIATLFFWPANGPQMMVQPYVGPGWTLSLEMLFYVGVSLALIGGKLRRNLLLITIAMAVIVWSRWTYAAAPLRLVGNRIFLEFGCGMALAFLLPRLRNAPASLGYVLLAVAAGFYGYVAATGDYNATDWLRTLSDVSSWDRLILFGAPALCLVAAAVILGRNIKRDVWTFLGDASYSIYLTHIAVLIGLSVFWRWLAWVAPPSLIIVTGVALGIGAGALVHLFVERPLQRGVRALPALIHDALSKVRRSKGPGAGDLGPVID